jgi:hypothetical protein
VIQVGGGDDAVTVGVTGKRRGDGSSPATDQTENDYPAPKETSYLPTHIRLRTPFPLARAMRDYAEAQRQGQPSKTWFSREIVCLPAPIHLL